MKVTKAEHSRTSQAESSGKIGSSFSVNFREARLTRGESLRAIATAVGAGLGTVQAWEKRGAVPRPPMLKKLAEHFGVPVVALLKSSVLIGDSSLTEMKEKAQGVSSVRRIRKECEDQLAELLDHAGENLERLGWIREQMRQHMRAPAHWFTGVSSMEDVHQLFANARSKRSRGSQEEAS